MSMSEFESQVDAEQSVLTDLIDKEVVLDTRGPLLYVGKLVLVNSVFYRLEEADVHDIVEGRASKEIYLIDACKNGVKQNRKSVFVRRTEVVSISLLEDVVVY